MPQTPDEELVRRLLADARHDEPMPADVAARLDGVLVELAGTEGRNEVVPLRPRRAPRRRWVVALAAAAAVVVAGVAVRSQGPVGDGSSGGSSTSAGDSASGSGSGSRETDGAPVVLHRATLRADVRRADRRGRSGLAAPQPAPAAPGCITGEVGPGRATAALLDGEPVVLVLRPPAGGRRVADVLECGTARVLASVTVPGR